MRVPGVAPAQRGLDLARLRLARLRCPFVARLGPGMRAARLRRVSAALRARVLAWCTRCFGTARLPPRRARLPPVYSRRSDHVIYINKNGNSI
jgi:hypothetical protein